MGAGFALFVAADDAQRTVAVAQAPGIDALASPAVSRPGRSELLIEPLGLEFDDQRSAACAEAHPAFAPSGRLQSHATGLLAWKRGQPGQVGNEAALTVATSAEVRLVTWTLRTCMA